MSLNGHQFRFNLQLVLDTASGAVVGASVHDREDSRAVRAAFHDAVTTTGKAPLALLLDRRACNRSAELGELGRETSLMYAGRGRPQSKAHVEGAFGLFAQATPPLCIDADNPRELARQIVTILVQCWARTLNHRPRSRCDGRTREALYRESLAGTAAWQVARDALSTRIARAHRPTRTRRQSDSALRGYIRGALERLGISDTDHYVETVLSSYSCDTVLASMATYQGKLDAGTLPDDADGRYLLGIARRISERQEGNAIAQALWRVRMAARDHLHTALDARRNAVLDDAGDPEGALDALVDEALAATNDVEQHYWIAALADEIRRQPEQQVSLYRRAVRRIHTSPSIPHRRQLALVRELAVDLIPCTTGPAMAREE